MKKSRKIVWTIIILLIGSFLIWYSTHPFVTIHVKDSNTKQYVQEPNLVFDSEITMIAGPGTGGGGPLIYSLLVPRYLTVTSNTYEYKEKTIKLFLIPGMSYTILLDK